MILFVHPIQRKKNNNCISSLIYTISFCISSLPSFSLPLFLLPVRIPNLNAASPPWRGVPRNEDAPGEGGTVPGLEGCGNIESPVEIQSNNTFDSENSGEAPEISIDVFKTNSHRRT